MSTARLQSLVSDVIARIPLRPATMHNQLLGLARNWHQQTLTTGMVVTDGNRAKLVLALHV